MHSSVNIFYSCLEEVKEIMSKIWLSPDTMKKEICSILSQIISFNEVVLSGETNNVSLYVILSDCILIYTPFCNINENIIIKRLNPDITYKDRSDICVVQKSQDLIDEINLPKVVLINPSVVDVFPVPRLCLGLSCIASYVRKYQLSDVRILDMQIEYSSDDIINEVNRISPEIIGISINFGQFDLACSILDKLFSENKTTKLIVAGNVISSFACSALISRYPHLIICNSEGERTLFDLIKYLRGDIRDLGEVSGISFLRDQRIHCTKTKLIDMNEVTFPAMDTVTEIINKGGALTMEMSRGCCHSACTFCPRCHKRIKWSGMSAQTTLQQLSYYKRIFDHFENYRRIFFADEEFIGWMDNGKEDERLSEIMQGLIFKNFDIAFDQDARIDQIYNPNKNKNWHIRRLQSLLLCKKAGLDRLLVGVESGSNTVLKRFNKQITIEQSVIALRLLSALGIGMRVTFITFDPLMTPEELQENIDFLQRRDVFLKSVNLKNITIAELFDAVHDLNFVAHNTANEPVYQHIAYMLVNLEPLFNSTYVKMVKAAEKENGKKLIADYGNMNYNMVRYDVRYVDSNIGVIAHRCQDWIDKNFAIDYCLKGFYKVANATERKTIFKFRAKYRKLSFQLLESLAQISFKTSTGVNGIKNAIIPVLNMFQEKMFKLILDMENAVLNGIIKDQDDRLYEAIQAWKKKEQSLINDRNLFGRGY